VFRTSGPHRREPLTPGGAPDEQRERSDKKSEDAARSVHWASRAKKLGDARPQCLIALPLDKVVRHRG
jgi:hypothetical protein